MLITKIALPTRPQTDTIIAIYILKAYGESFFPGIRNAKYEVISNLTEGKTEKDYLKEGTLLIDVGGGIFDHHGKIEKTTASNLVARAIGIQDDPSIRKMLDVAERCDFYGKATISEDSLDRAFGIAGVISALNKTSSGDPDKVIEPMLVILRAHHLIEKMRTEEMPKEIELLKEKDLFEDMLLLQRKNKLKVCFVESDNVGLPGFLRATDGGKYDIVVQKRSTGHVNILTRPLKKTRLERGICSCSL